MWHLKNNAIYAWKNVLGEPVQRAKGVTIGKAFSRVLILAVGFHLGSWFAYFALDRFSQEPIQISKKALLAYCLLSDAVQFVLLVIQQSK